MLLGKAALAMWWDIAPEMCAEFEHWHAHEHFPERLSIQGFLRSSRWKSADGGEGVFVMYELSDYDVLASSTYIKHLNAPSPWSMRMMPHHRHMIRSQCHVLESRGGAIARHALTIRLSPTPGQEQTLRSALSSLAGEIVNTPGLAGVHLLRHQTPDIAPTREQIIRSNADRVADWVLVVCGYDGEALDALSAERLSDAGLSAMGASAGAQRATYTLSQSATPVDTA